MNFAWLSSFVCIDLAERCLAEHACAADERERRRALRDARRAIETAEGICAMPDPTDAPAWNRWREEHHGVKPPVRVEVPREDLERSLADARRELAEMRRELARRDAEAEAAWTGTEE